MTKITVHNRSFTPAQDVYLEGRLSIQFDLTDLRGSSVASTYSVENGPKPVI